MFQGVHHITYLVWDLDSVEAYFSKHFGLEPIQRENKGPGRNIAFQVGPTVLRFTQPTRTASGMEYELLRRFGGPVISHIGLVVASLDKTSQELRDGGVDFTQSEVTVSPHGGYELIDIASEGSCGMRSQNELFALNKMLPDSRVGIRLQLCENTETREELSSA